MSKEINIIHGALYNTLDKLKAMARKGKSVPPVNEVYQLFATISPVEIKTDQPPTIPLNTKTDNFETIFFFNNMKVYLSLSYRHAEYRGHPFIDFVTKIHFIDELDPDEYMDAEIIKYLQNNFKIQIP